MEIPSGKVINVRYNEEWGAPEHKPIEAIMPLLFSETDISKELDLFSENDKKNIMHGVPSLGMSKRAVIVALGYPAAHMTTSIEDDIWTYWRNRFLQFYIRFENGNVSDISSFKPRRFDDNKYTGKFSNTGNNNAKN